MILFHKYQSKGFQFSLDLFAHLSVNPIISKKEVAALSRAAGLEYPDQVMLPLLRHGILDVCQEGYTMSATFVPCQLTMSRLEQEYLSFVLGLPLCETFLNERGLSQLSTLFPPTQEQQQIQWYAPESLGEENQISSDWLRCLLEGAREGRLVAYEEKETHLQCQRLPYQLEYDAYLQQWRVFLYDVCTQNMERVSLDSLQNIRPLDMVSNISRKQLQKAMEARLAPQPITLTVSKERGTLERCFLAFQHREFLETRHVDDTTYHLSFYYDRDEEDEILHRLLYLGPCVTLDSPPYLRKRLLKLVLQGLEHCAP